MSTETFVLVVGTDPAERETMVRTLSDEQYRVTTAENPEEALEYVGDAVDLVISELHADEFDGLDFLRTWKERQPRTPVVVVTESDDVASAVEAMKAGAADCIVKPVDSEELRTLVHKLLEAEGENGHVDDAARLHASRKSRIDIPPGTSLEDLERAAVEQALAQHHGNRTHAAKTLGISVRTLQRKLKAWGIPVVSSHSQDSQNSAQHFLLPSHAASSAYSAQAH